MWMDSGQGLWWSVCAAACASSWLLVRAAIVYAYRRGMLDAPGQRRSHSIPTPRGGGIGPVVITLIGGTWALLMTPPPLPRALVGTWAAGIAVVSAVGWWDDHHDLPAWPRLLAQSLVTGTFCSALIAVTGLSWWWLPFGVVAGTGSINLHNFMDGIDGLLAQQMIFFGIVVTILGLQAGQPGIAWAAAIMASACVGFWLHNRSPARIFMGDVGSGTMGLLVFMFIALLSARELRAVWPMLAACSGFLIDAGLTLLWRMVRGRRWYTAHREHLYQWLVRCGWTHTRTGSLYMVWNLLTLPAAWVAWHWPAYAPGIIALVYLCGAVLWRQARMACLHSVSRRAVHELA